MTRRLSGMAGSSRRLAVTSQWVVAARAQWLAMATLCLASQRVVAERAHRLAIVFLACGLASGISACTPIPERGAAADGEAPAATDPALGAVDRPRPLASGLNVELLEIGSTVPEFVLRDQDGNFVSASAWRGKVVVLTFFETRSPQPTLCPELIDRLSELRELLLPERTSDFHLVGASVDPVRDTADTLAAWARDRGIGGDGWTIGAMDAETLTRVATRLGVALWQRADGSVGHTLNTIVVDRRGRFVDQFPGVSGWSITDLLAAVTAAADR